MYPTSANKMSASRHFWVRSSQNFLKRFPTNTMFFWGSNPKNVSGWESIPDPIIRQTCHPLVVGTAVVLLLFICQPQKEPQNNYITRKPRIEFLVYQTSIVFAPQVEIRSGQERRWAADGRLQISAMLRRRWGTNFDDQLYTDCRNFMKKAVQRKIFWNLLL